MEEVEYEKMFKLEQSHWWFLGKKKIVLSQLDCYNHKDKDQKILDVGCGTGAMMKALEDYGTVYGVDYSADAVRFCKQRGLTKVKIGSIMTLPFPDNYFDVITCLDVLYHKGITNDQLALNELYRVCKKGGTVIITDSACKALWSRHDLAVHARERYSKRELTEKVQKTRLTIKKISYYNFFLFPIVFIVRKLDNIIIQNKKPESNVEETSFLVNKALFSILSIESFLLKHLSFPWGVSLICVAEKKRL